MADNTQHSIFRERTGRPGCVAFRGEPGMGAVVLHVSGVDQRNQDAVSYTHLDVYKRQLGTLPAEMHSSGKAVAR